MENVNTTENQIQEMPVFLKVLCILTFIGSGIGILGAFYSIFTVDQSLESLQRAGSIMEQSPLFSNMDAQIEAIRKWGLISGILSLIGNCLCLFGALLMWKLKKNGFFIYIAGHIFPTIGAILYVSAMSKGNDFLSSMSYAQVVIQIVFSAAFIIMYGVNSKHLK